MSQLLNTGLQKRFRFINFSRLTHLFTQKQPQSELQSVARTGSTRVAVMDKQETPCADTHQAYSR